MLESLDQALFLWCGVQQAGVPEGREFGVLQPVLMFGADCVQDLPAGKDIGPYNDATYKSQPYWYMSAQHVYPDHLSPSGFKCTTGPILKVIPGEVLESSITYDELTAAMTVQVSTQDGRESSTLVVAHPKDDPTLTWRQFIGSDHLYFNAMGEVPNPDPSRPLPAELLNGWSVTAMLEPSSTLSPLAPESWQLRGDPCHALAIECVHDPSRLESLCTWSKRADAR